MREGFMKEINMDTIILENKIKNFKTFLLLIILFLFQTNLNSYENKIIFKIDNEIITNLDVENEIIYLTDANNIDKAIEGTVLDNIGLLNPCCRCIFLTHVDIE